MAEEAGHWVTIDGEHVFIKDGVITKGPDGLIGKSADHASGTPLKLGDRITLPEYTGAPGDGRNYGRVQNAEVVKLTDKSVTVRQKNDALSAAMFGEHTIKKIPREHIAKHGTINKSAAPMTVAASSFLILAAAADFGQANVVTGSLDYVSKLPKDIDGQPVEYREKEMIYCGQFFDEKTGNPFTIDQSRLDKWVNNFQRWTAAGNPVPLPAVDHFKGDEKLQGTSLGNLLTLERRGDKLYGLHQFIGADAIAAAARNDSSVFVEAGKIDGKGNVYDEVLTHNLITPKPLIPGLSRFKIAASHSNNSIVILSEKTPERSNLMPLLDELKTALKLDAGADEAAVSKAFKDHMTAVAASLSTLETTKTALSASQTALAAAQPKMPDDYTLGLLNRSLKTERDAAVKAAGIEAVEAVEAIFMPDKKLNALALSQADGGDPTIFRVFTAFTKVKSVPLGQMSGVTLAAALPIDSRVGPAGVAAAQGGQQAEDQQMVLLKQQTAAYSPAAK